MALRASGPSAGGRSYGFGGVTIWRVNPGTFSRSSCARLLARWYRFARFSAAGFSMLLPLAGALRAGPIPPSQMLAGIVLGAWCFHVFAYAVNDVVDLSLDRTEALRAEYPLVKGEIRSATALTIAAAHMALALAVSYSLRASIAAEMALIAAFSCMTIYNLYGKKFAFPPATDLIQGVGWAALTAWGAIVNGDSIGMVRLLLLNVTIYILLINGVHGSLRDLVNDAACGARTTALLMGVRPLPDGALFLPLSFRLYAFALQLMLIACATAATPGRWGVITMAACLAIHCLWTLAGTLRREASRKALIECGKRHLIASLLLLFLPFFADLSPKLLLWPAVTFAIPILAMRQMASLSKGSGRRSLL